MPRKLINARTTVKRRVGQTTDLRAINHDTFWQRTAPLPITQLKTQQEATLEAERLRNACQLPSEATLEANCLRVSRLRAPQSQEHLAHRLEIDRIQRAKIRALELESQSQEQQALIREKYPIQKDKLGVLQMEKGTVESKPRIIPYPLKSKFKFSQYVEDKRKAKMEAKRLHAARMRSLESHEQRKARLEAARIGMARLRAIRSQQTEEVTTKIDSQSLSAFNYNSNYDYSLHPSVTIGKMDTVCSHCGAIKFKNETIGMCCANGKVKLPILHPPPDPLLSLLSGTSVDSKHFFQNIRKYNSAFQMTSCEAHDVFEDKFMSTFKIQGEINQHLGSLLPVYNNKHKYLQIYFMDDDDVQVDQRCCMISGINPYIIKTLQTFLHEHNALVKLFKLSIDLLPADNYAIHIRADKPLFEQDAKTYNTPNIDEIAIVICEEKLNTRDIIVQRRNDTIERVAETHRSYDALQYPLIFWEGEDGYHFNIVQDNPIADNKQPNKKVSAMNYYSYRLMIPETGQNFILQYRKLFHQYLVDMYAKIESVRLLYIRLNQKSLRTEESIHLRDAIMTDGNVSHSEKVVMLPSTFTGSPRHMHEYALDTIAYMCSYGSPDLLITFKCNPGWDEIKQLLVSDQAPFDRPDLIARVFNQKLIKLLDLIEKFTIFGETRCWTYSIKWQKIGFPKAYILIWLNEKINSEKIDDLISAEIPNLATDPILCDIVTKHMIHVPCGGINSESSCLVNNKCTKTYPREYICETRVNTNGYPQYRRREPGYGGQSIIMRLNNVETETDNRWIIPYSPLLCKIFNAHINIEYCNSVKAIKHISNYFNKDRDTGAFNDNNPDEVSQFQKDRYISSNEAVWRIFNFPIFGRYPKIVHLSVHLENGQRTFAGEENSSTISAGSHHTTLTAFFELCKQDSIAKILLYSEIPRYYIWIPTSKKFQRRKKGTKVQGYENLYFSEVLGRMYTVHPSNEECYYLRMLLTYIRGPTSFENLRNIDGVQFETNKEACQKLQLLQGDQHWKNTLTEASLSFCSPRKIRVLFSIILTTCSPSNPIELWEKFKENMSEDILDRIRIITIDSTLLFSNKIFNEALIEIEDICLNINNKALIQLGMVPPQRTAYDLIDHDLWREQNFNTNELELFVEKHIPLLLREQWLVYEKVISAVGNNESGLLFLDAPGGTGKTFLMNLLLAKIRSENGIALALASTSIGATLLDSGRIAHSALQLPLNMKYTEEQKCDIFRGSGMAKVLKTCKLIVWDECSMAHKYWLEALDRTLQDLRKNEEIFGGALILLAGDFRQSLPVLEKSRPADELNACLKASHIWRHVQRLTLTTNMRIQYAQKFPEQLLDIGNGEVPVEATTNYIKFPSDFCIFVPSIQNLIEKVFPRIATNYKYADWLCQRVILAANNIDVNVINIAISEHIPEEQVIYKSIDSIINPNETINYPIEFLNSLDIPDGPPHKLLLKIGVPIILLRNIHPPQLCSGTRLVVKQLMPNLIEATILNGQSKGEDVMIPRIPIIFTEMPFSFRRLQFPVRLAFSMTIDRAQGQSFDVCGLSFENSCFSHGQLYLACSRVRHPTNLFIFAKYGRTKNIVYSEALK